MDVVVERCAGLDVHKDTVVACVRTPGKGGRQEQTTRTFKTMTADLLALRDWLVAMGVTRVGMESTGVYWKPVFYILEDGMECWLLNARHLRNVPGRKTDVQDAQWICQLVEHGLVRPSFVPPKPIRELRDLTRYRKAQIDERGREAQRLDKVLQDAGIKLSSVATDILGKSGRDMLAALISGTCDPQVLAELARGRLRTKIPLLRRALEGHFVSRHRLIVEKILAKLDFLDETIEDLSVEIDRLIAPFAVEVDLLDTITGVDRRAAECIIAEIGVEMARFGSSARLASWAGRCPGHHESAGNTSRADPGRAPNGLPPPWPSAPKRLGAPRAPTWAPSSSGCAGDAGMPRHARPLSTRSWSPPITCSIAASPTRTSGRTGSSGAAPRSTPAAWPTRSKHSDSASPSNPPNKPPKLTQQHNPGRRTSPAPGSSCAHVTLFSD
jgi:transposase